MFLALTTPFPLTLALPPSLLCQLTGLPVTTFPPASLATAVSCALVPSRRVSGEGVTVTVATAPTITVMDAVALLPSLVAVMDAVPRFTPVTTPVGDTVATPVVPELHVIVRPVSTLPFASLNVAERVVVAPTPTLADVGATVTVETGSGTTVTVAVPLFPSLVAVIVAVPADTPVTTPFKTVATPVALELQVTTRPVSVLPFASVSVGTSVVV